MTTKTQRCAAFVAAVGIAIVTGASAAHAAGDNGASDCSAAGNPATSPNPGLALRRFQPFGGVGNDGINPGHAPAPGLSACKPL